MTFPRFSHFLAIDWSGAAGERHKGIALALADAAGGPPVLIDRGRGWSRADVLALLLEDLPPDTLVGLDLGMSLPFADCEGFFPGLTNSPPDARSLWAMVDDICADDPHLGASSFVDHPDLSTYFRRHGGREGERFRCDGAAHGRGRFRVTEHAQAAQGCKPYSNFNLIGAAQVGKSSLTGMRVLHRLEGALPVWPVDPLPETGSVLVEIYTSLAALDARRSAARSKIRTIVDLNRALGALASPPVAGDGPIDDHSSDALLAAVWLRDVANDPARWQPGGLTREIARTEGWTFGAL
ncbi:hypothetical protein D2V04_09455 [Pelagerythrobacter aerophilus]|uniref:DUF429 domain-containing protein n=1 Tax=Pelagerythrobacter aerophilus TaxID=2306995 RepID=A0A418NHK8_9SPHN|nr:hypothetical protein [Pelagerythrobacter aerophilus]RIV78097.1 hypothetical protein D2V04_09455 [Pelagerythrobacter aerophilus]